MKKTLKVVCEAKVHIASKVLVVKRNPEIAIDFVKIVDAIMAHTIVFGQNDLYGVPEDRQFIRKPLNSISQTADFGNRCAFRSDHDDIHLYPISISLAAIEMAHSRYFCRAITTSFFPQFDYDFVGPLQPVHWKICLKVWM